MKKLKYILSLLAIFSFMSSYSAIDNLFNQLNIPDSLKKSYISSKKQEDRIKVLNDIGYYLSANNPSNSITISNLALIMADSIKYEEGIFDATNNIGIAYSRSSKFKQAIEWFSKARKIAQSSGADKKLASIYNNMALVYNYLSDYNKALKLNNEALKIRISLKDTAGIATSYNNIGTTYHYKTDYKTALEYYNKALGLKKSQNDKDGIAHTFNNIGSLFFEMYSDTAPWALDSALKYFIKSYYSWHLTANKVGLSQVLPNIGNVYSLQNHRDKAIDAYNAALNIQKQISDSTGMSLTFYNLGMEYYNLGNLKLAQDYFQKSYNIAITFNITDVLKDNMKMMAYIIGKDKNNYKTAFDYAIKYIQINDSLDHLSRLQLMDDFSGKYDYQSSENNRLSSSLDKTKLWVYILAAFSLILLSSLLYFVLKRR